MQKIKTYINGFNSVFTAVGARAKDFKSAVEIAEKLFRHIFLLSSNEVIFDFQNKNFEFFQQDLFISARSLI